MSLVFPLRAASGLERRTARTRSVVSCPHVIPNRTWPAAPEIPVGTARRLPGIESPPQDHRRNGRQSHHPSRLSCARPRPIDRTRNAGTRWRATAKPLLPAVFPHSSPTTGHLRKLRPSTISGSGEVSDDRPRGAQQTSSSIRGSCCQRNLECPHRAPSSLASIGCPPSARPTLDAGRDRAETHKKSL